MKVIVTVKMKNICRLFLFTSKMQYIVVTCNVYNPLYELLCVYTSCNELTKLIQLLYWFIDIEGCFLIVIDEVSYLLLGSTSPHVRHGNGELSVHNIEYMLYRV
jgi:hypothetical protein